VTMRRKLSKARVNLAFWAALLFLTIGAIRLNAQFPYPGAQYRRGQDVSPTFDGWESNPDGTFSFYFGYYNRNSDEEIDVPLGPENRFDLGDGDQGQPTHFYPGRRWFVFKVVMPKDWPKDKRVVWTLTNRGRTNVSKGWLQPEWEIDQLLISKNAISDPFLRAANTNPSAENKPPVITGGSAPSVTLPGAATLKVTVTDDGLPKPGPGDRGGKVEGVRVQWILYRGPDKVQFDPSLSPAVYGKPLTSETKVNFSAPGNYRIRAIATDGALFSTYDVDVKVNPSNSAQTSR
jgi:hypothetical protein